MLYATIKVGLKARKAWTEMSYYDGKAVDEADVNARNLQTQDNRASNQSMSEDWVVDASP